MTKVWPGSDYPLGATYDGAGTNFAIFSEIAERVELCLFDEKGNETRFDLPEITSFCWHGYLRQSRARPALRLSSPRTLGASGRTSLQSG